MFCVCKHPFNWTHSGASETGSLVSTRLITWRITRTSYYSQLLWGFGRAMICNHYIKSQLALMHWTGVLVTWMLSSNGTTGTISFFLNWVKTASPAVQPSIIMMDHDLAQIKAIKAIYPDSQIFLCIWHVLCAIRSHFVLEKFQSLWAKVKSLVKTEDSHKFDRIWTEISTNSSVP